MNIFVLSYEPRLAAQYHCDKHVNKMILESAQMLCATINRIGGTTPYRTTHENHPCSIWTRASYSNFEWLTELAKELNTEYRKRYNKQINHKSWETIKQVVKNNRAILRTLPHIGPTDFALAMPEECKNQDTVAAYRAYYRTKEFASWDKGTAAPWWW
jgi:hypothetical protein